MNNNDNVNFNNDKYSSNLIIYLILLFLKLNGQVLNIYLKQHHYPFLCYLNLKSYLIIYKYFVKISKHKKHKMPPYANGKWSILFYFLLYTDVKYTNILSNN